MNERSWIDKSSWPDGPWKTEPDKIEWRDEATGLPCMIRRNARLGFWCGYVGVTEWHPAFRQGQDENMDIEVHGGLTFASSCDGDKERGICHTPEPGESDDVWWLGFDCGHLFDLAPGNLAWQLERGFPVDKSDIYRDVAYVQQECVRLAAQLKEMAA